MNLYKRTSGALLVVLLSGCTNEALYTTVQNNRLQECDRMVAAQRETCIAQHNMPYEDYERERQGRLNDSQ
jgi:hypothetical protein